MKILVIHASAGAGHLKAAEAVYNGLKKQGQGEAFLVDSLDHTSKYFKRLYRGTYVNLVLNTPSVWGLMFWLINIPFLQVFVRTFRRLHNWTFAQGLHVLLKREQYDVIISTHFLPNEVASALKRQGKIKSKIIAIITDYDVHKIWIARGIDRYVVASEWTKRRLTQLGVPSEKVSDTGIPCDEKFLLSPDIGKLKRGLHLKENVFTVLLATGSFGIGPIEEIIRLLEGFQVIVVCGHNKKLFQTLTRENPKLVKVCGLVSNMYELMAVSDAMVTKPGGLSVTEALVSHLPLIFFNAIPGQETNNINVLSHYGVGFNPKNIEQIAQEVKKLQSSRDYYKTTQNRVMELAHPSAVEEILNFVNE